MREAACIEKYAPCSRCIVAWSQARTQSRFSRPRASARVLKTLVPRRADEKVLCKSPAFALFPARGWRAVLRFACREPPRCRNYVEMRRRGYVRRAGHISSREITADGKTKQKLRLRTRNSTSRSIIVSRKSSFSASFVRLSISLNLQALTIYTFSLRYYLHFWYSGIEELTREF